MEQDSTTELNTKVIEHPNARDRRQVKQLEAQTKRKQALQLRLAGATYQEIADALGYANRNGAFFIVTSALKSIPKEEANELRELEKQRLDRLQRAVAKRAHDGEIGAVLASLKISESRRRLLGLDEPVKIHGTGFGNTVLILEHAHEHIAKPGADGNGGRLAAITSGSN
jgi:hypothetical protein